MGTKQRILDTAIDQINKKGLGKVGVRDIARTLNISPGNMSYHFPKKDDLILELLRTYSAKNSEFYEAYSSEDPTLGRFMGLFRKLFTNQYANRGVLVGQEEVNRILSEARDFDYPELEKRRKRTISNILRELNGIGHLSISEEDIRFLVSFLSLFGRFWIMEAFISFPNKSQHELIDHYLGLLRTQMLMFATDDGRNSL